MISFYLLLGAPLLVWIFNLIFSFFRTQKSSFFLLFFGFLAVLINGFFFFFSFNKDKRLAYFFQTAGFLVQVLILIYLIFD